MAIGTGFSKTVTEGLIFGYDTADAVNSYPGRPTTNQVGTGMSIYNNVPGSVSATLTTNGEFYRGAPVYVQTLTALDGSGVSWLSNGNNPGIGVVSGGGGGPANTFTGHSIFFKPTVPMNGTPIFLHYSNIGGWQQCCTQPEDMGDGWFRAYVLWFDTVTRSDGKYWAINPLSAVQGVPITVYWAGPFKEELNSQTVSQYTVSSRSTTQSLKDLTSSWSINLNSVSFTNDIQPKIIFDGTDDTIDTGIPLTNLPALSNFTLECVVKLDAYPTAAPPNAYNNTTRAGVLLGAAYYSGVALYWYGNSSGTACTVYAYIRGNDGYRNTGGFGLVVGRFHHLLLVNSNSNDTLSLYADGNLIGAVGTATQQYNSGLTSTAGNIGISKPQVDGGGENVYSHIAASIPIARIYNRALTVAEVRQNYNLYRARFRL